MSTFDPNAFEEQIVQGENATTIIPPPEGSGYAAIIDNYKFEVAGEDKKPVCNVMFKLMDDARLQSVGLDASTMLPIRHTLWLDRDDSGALARGPNSNVALGKLREALGQNKPGKPWQWSQLRGAGPVLLTIGHRADKNDPSIKYPDIKKVEKAK